MMEEARTSETLVHFYQTARRYNPEDSHLRSHRRENFKSYLYSFRLGLLQEILHYFHCIFFGPETYSSIDKVPLYLGSILDAFAVTKHQNRWRLPWSNEAERSIPCSFRSVSEAIRLLNVNWSEL
jgi:hypothetical protein